MEWLSGILEPLARLRDPIAFWSLLGILATWVAITLIRNPRIIEILFHTSRDKISANNFYRLIRMFFVMIFVTLWMSLLGALGAPLALKMIEQHRSDTAQIVGAIEVDKKLAQAFELYRNHDYEGASHLFGEVFEDPSIDSERRGQIVSSFFQAGDYAKCAKAVLARLQINKTEEKLLWPDMWLCVRRYALAHSELEAIDLVDGLRQEYGNALATRLWVYAPAELAMALRSGHHNNRHILRDESLTGVDTHSRINSIRKITEADAASPYAALGYYMIGEYEKALTSPGHQLIEPVLLFAIGLQNSVEGGAGALEDGKAKYPRAAWAFEQLITRFPRSDMADDATLNWARNEADLGNNLAAIALLRKHGAVGNGDRDYGMESLMFDLFQKLAAGEQQQLVMSDAYFLKHRDYAYYWTRTLLRRGQLAEAEKAGLEVLQKIGFDISTLRTATPQMTVQEVRDAMRVAREAREAALSEVTTAAGSGSAAESSFDVYGGSQAETLVPPDDINIYNRWTVEDLRYVVEAAREIDDLSADQNASFQTLLNAAYKFRIFFKDYRSAIRVYDIGIQRFPAGPEFGAMSYGKIVAIRDLLERVTSYAFGDAQGDKQRDALGYLDRLWQDGFETLQKLDVEAVDHPLADDAAAEYVCMASNIYQQLWWRLSWSDPNSQYDDPAADMLRARFDLNVLREDIGNVLGIVRDRYRGRNGVDNALFCWAEALKASENKLEANKLYLEVFFTYSGGRLAGLAAENLK